jgi:hypothetical protein
MGMATYEEEHWFVLYISLKQFNSMTVHVQKRIGKFRMVAMSECQESMP